MMKKTFIILITVMSIMSCKAQIIPIEDHINYYDNEIEIADGAYIKDVNNLLPKFIGTWLGNYNNKNYEFVITKITDNFLGISNDILQMRFKITDANGNIIDDTTNLPNNSSLVCNGRFILRSHTYVLSYVGNNAECGESGDIFISININNNNSMELKLSPDKDLISDNCNSISFIIPTEPISLTKQ